VFSQLLYEFAFASRRQRESHGNSDGYNSESRPRYQLKQKLTTKISKLGSLDCDQIVP
jgi:hypothetical protein